MPYALDEKALRQWALDRSQKRGNVLLRVIPANDAIGVALEVPNLILIASRRTLPLQLKLGRHEKPAVVVLPGNCSIGVGL
jgi:hypothetical protein